MERQDTHSFSAHFRPPVSFETPAASSGHTSTRTEIVEFRSGEAVQRHPELAAVFRKGWKIRSATPYVDGTATVRLMVVLERGDTKR